MTLICIPVILKALGTTVSPVLLGFRACIERFEMYLSTLDLLAVMIALVVSVTLVISTALANARITESRNYWREAYFLAEQDISKDGM